MEDLEPEQRPSKSQLKREMLALQALGEELTQLSAKELDHLVSDERLRTAIAEMHRIKSREARRRQLQFIGKLMRNVDVSVIEDALASRRNARQRANEAFHALEAMRDALIDGSADPHTALTPHFPGADLQRIRQLVLQARRERDGSKPPSSSRKLLRYLRELQTEQD